MNYFDQYGIKKDDINKILPKLEKIFQTRFNVGGGWGQVLYRPPVDQDLSLVLAQNHYEDWDGEQLYEPKHPDYKFIFDVFGVSEKVSKEIETKLTVDGFMCLLSREKIEGEL